MAELGPAIHEVSQVFVVMAGLGPAIHDLAFARREVVDARPKGGHDDESCRGRLDRYSYDEYRMHRPLRC